jgi:hypothetical protein
MGVALHPRNSFTASATEECLGVNKLSLSADPS